MNELYVCVTVWVPAMTVEVVPPVWISCHTIYSHPLLLLKHRTQSFPHAAHCRFFTI